MHVEVEGQTSKLYSSETALISYGRLGYVMYIDQYLCAHFPMHV